MNEKFLDGNFLDEQVIISSLLHDIGKFAQRAKQSCSKNLESTYCKEYQGRYSHKHVLYSNAFLESSSFRLPSDLAPFKEDIARMASAHHNPGVLEKTNLIEHILQKADCLSSGMDRIKDEENTEDQQFDRAHFQSIFSQITLEKKHKNTWWHGLNPLDDYKKVFPCNQKDANPHDYTALFELFRVAMENIPLDEGFPNYLSSLVSILEKYTYCIPSCTYKTKPDVSLFDHSVTTAAIAQALWQNAKEFNITENKDIQKLDFYLFSGEFSGIQKYIFTGEGGKGFTKILRARSFQLQALTRSIILYVLDKLELNPIAKIMDAGGKFILLLPKNEKIYNKILEIQQNIEKYFLKEFHGELKMPTVLLEVKQSEMEQKHFLKKLDELNDSLEEEKLKLFSYSFKEDRAAIHDITFHHGICEFCLRKPLEKEDSSEDASCVMCAKLIEIGKLLPRSHYALFTKEKPSNRDFLELINGIYLILDGGENFTPKEKKNALDIINMKTHDKYTSYPIAGHLPTNPENEKEAMSFEQIAKASAEDGKGIPVLGVLKADVDNLGLVFSLGFGQELSVSRFANLSRMLNFFFSEYLVHIIEKNEFNIYTVFTGGDDLFVLGAWTDIVKFAEILRTDFARFTGENPNITLSAGLVLAKPKLPISAIADMAENALEESKHYPDKNACTFFDIPVSWDEFSKQIKQGSRIEEKILTNTITQGLVRRLLSYADDFMAFTQKDGGDIKKGLYASHLKYDLARNLDDRKEEQKLLKEEILELTSKENFANARMALSYAIYKTRSY